MSGAPFEKLAVVGLGLLGGSVALAARAHGAADTVVAWTRRAETARDALARGAVEAADTDPAVLEGCDLLVLATPIETMPAILAAAAPHLGEGALVTDVGSVKGCLAETLPGLLPATVRYVGSHPMAGSHRRGLEHAQMDLFEGAACIVDASAAPPDAARLRAFWEALGARVLLRSAVRHDEEVGWISHAPHAVAFAFARALDEAPEAASELRGPGFRDFTRIAHSDPELWAEILCANGKALAGPLAAVADRLRELARAAEQGDTETTLRYLAAARDSLARLAPAPDPGAETRRSIPERKTDDSNE
ncbi:MAG: prephenate dehydrogenase [Myxococcales bacterium]|nr:prephenate dehydrogenase [Myxococcales bacterium]